MLELELALAPFVRERLTELDAADLARYERLLSFDDWDIYEWLLARGPVLDPELEPLVEAIRSAGRT